MIKKIIFNTAKEQFRKAFRKYKSEVRNAKTLSKIGKTPGVEPYDIKKMSIKRQIRNTKFMDKAAYQQAPKTQSNKWMGKRPQLIGKAYASDKKGKGLQIPMISAKERAAVQEGISQSVRKFMRDKIGRKKYGGVTKAFKGKYFDEQKTNVKGKDRTEPVRGGNTPEIPPQEFMKYKKYKQNRVISAYTGKAVRQPTETNKEFKMRHAYHTPFMKSQPKLLHGGLLTAAIKEGAKKFFKASGKKIVDLQKSAPLKSRSAAKMDYARGLQLHTEGKAGKEKIQKYIRTRK